jgi:hypothetical protein
LTPFSLCGNPIEYFITIAHEPYTSLNNTSRPIIISGGAYFACAKCSKNIIASWEKHNEERTEPYAIQTAKVSVKAKTKENFMYRVQPQIFSQFDWYVPKRDIQGALTGTKKVKE